MAAVSLVNWGAERSDMVANPSFRPRVFELAVLDRITFDDPEHRKILDRRLSVEEFSKLRCLDALEFESGEGASTLVVLSSSDDSLLVMEQPLHRSLAKSSI